MKAVEKKWEVSSALTLISYSEIAKVVEKEYKDMIDSINKKRP